MSLKKNYIYNSVLFISQYIFPLLTFPYITRVFGVEKVGLVNFVDSITDYTILLSTMGLSIIGLRECARYKDNKTELSKTFSGLLSLHFLNTILFLVVYLILISVVDKFRENQILFYIGISKIICIVFNIEWFYKGIENFKFITLRFLFVKAAFVLLVFLLVKTPDDYIIYYALVCAMTVINSFISIYFLRGKVSLIKPRNLKIFRHFKAVAIIGFYNILTSLYATFNIAFLGIYTNNISVGYYTTALKLYMIIIGVFTALNTVLMPRLSSLQEKEDGKTFDSLIQKSMKFVIIFSAPIIFSCVTLAPQLITFLAGNGFEGAILCFRIIIPLIFIVGIAQILANQIMITKRKDKELLYISMIGGGISVLLNILLVPKYHEIASSIILVASEIIVLSALILYLRKRTKFHLPPNYLIKNILLSIPYIIICYFCTLITDNNLGVLVISLFISLLYFFCSQYYIMKEDLVVEQLDSIKRRYINN